MRVLIIPEDFRNDQPHRFGRYRERAKYVSNTPQVPRRARRPVRPVIADARGAPASSSAGAFLVRKKEARRPWARTALPAFGARSV